MNEDAGEPDLEGHLSPEDLAVLAEGRGSERTVLGAAEHLARCRSCMSAYADVVRYRAGWLAFPDAFAGDTGVPAAPRGGRAGARTRSFSRSHLWATAAALVVLVGVALFWLAGRHEPRRDEGPIAALLERASADGLVIPGGESGAAPSSTLYRSQTAVDRDFERTITRMMAEYESSNPANRDVFPLAASLVAAGQLDLARSYIAEGSIRAPDDAKLMILAGIVAHRRGDLAEAERQMRRAVAVSPGNLTAQLNLGLLVAESRGTPQAATYLNEVIRKAPGSPLARRAEAALAGPGRP